MTSLSGFASGQAFISTWNDRIISFSILFCSRRFKLLIDFYPSDVKVENASAHKSLPIHKRTASNKIEINQVKSEKRAPLNIESACDQIDSL